MNLEQRISILEKTLLERDYSTIIAISKAVVSQIRNLKSKILDPDQPTVELIELINKPIKYLGVQFGISMEFGDFGYNSDYTEVGLHYAQTESNGDVTLFLLNDFYDRIDSNNFSYFLDIVETILIHEYTHVAQLEKARNHFKGVDIESSVKYLSNIHEIQAHANQAMSYGLKIGYSIEDLTKLLKNPKNSKVEPQEIDAFWKYYDIFYGEYGDKKVWDRFLKYCFQYLYQLESEEE